MGHLTLGTVVDAGDRSRSDLSYRPLPGHDGRGRAGPRPRPVPVLGRRGLGSLPREPTPTKVDAKSMESPKAPAHRDRLAEVPSNAKGNLR